MFHSRRDFKMGKGVGWVIPSYLYWEELRLERAARSDFDYLTPHDIARDTAMFARIAVLMHRIPHARAPDAASDEMKEEGEEEAMQQ